MRMKSTGVVIAITATLALAFAAVRADAQAPVPATTVKALTTAPGVPFAGRPQANVTIIEYMDFNCQYCRRQQPELQTLMNTDPNVRVLYKEWPIFGGVSVYAAKVALAASWQGKFLQVHTALIGAPSRLTSEQDVRDIARKAGADLGRLDQDLKAHGAAISALLSRNDQEARSLGLEGTPGLVIGETLVGGALSLAELQQVVNYERQGARASH
jgi:protein-disulfide isomerase